MSSNQLRSLMKERQQAKRISHPYARYVGAKLTCTACSGMAVKAEALWASHLTSKSHRLNVQRLQKEQEQAAAAAAASKGKRRADETDIGDVTLSPGGTAKRVRFSEAGDEVDENGAQDDDGSPAAEATGTSSLPAGFFDDPSQAPPPTADEEDDDAPPAAAGEEDPEWAAFEATLNAPESSDRAGEAFARATVVAEPVMIERPGDEEAEGAAPAEDEAEAEEEGTTETEEERRIREEKEEIMERIETEEREQAEADERVVRMKARLDAIRAARAAKSQAA